MILSHIVAVAKNGVIGANGKMPWHIPEELEYFKYRTEGHTLIMGRKTFESLGKPLKKRMHIVVSSNKDFSYDGFWVRVVPSIDEALKLASKLMPLWGREVFVIGGGTLYRQTLDMVDFVYLTVIDKDFDGDTFYPDLPEFFVQSGEEKREGSPSLSFKTFYRNK